MRKTIAIGCATLALGAWAGAADVKAQVPAGCATVLTSDCLSAALTSLGLAPKPVGKGYLVTLKRDNWTSYVTFVLSDNGAKLGLNTELGDVNEASVTAAQWEALLAANADIEPTIFFYDAAKKRLYLHRVIDNRNLTGPILREEFEKFVGAIRHTAPIWGPVAH